ncbi:MAG: hypothetical protein H6821_16640 [Planctomycetaceae bacterium]|nr:hypothetical protein [Planctomycetales bacterium]MCB9875800.1 hypothetical protein [Planctomycetaceae bacterium]MCB9940647.1 hypothetical protein [Planctomycetaceae bacterium]HRX77978.1 hypothetical protein [Pirellulaceae bacterium]
MNRSAETIRKEMQCVRREIADDVQDVVESTRQMTDWHSYVNRYPLVCVGAAAVVGFLLVPKRVEIMSPDEDTLLRLAKKSKLVVKNAPQSQAKSGLAGTMIGLLGNAVLRAGIAYVGQNIGKVAGEAGAVQNQS